jgi:hypothetical protein
LKRESKVLEIVKREAIEAPSSTEGLGRYSVRRGGLLRLGFS